MPNRRDELSAEGEWHPSPDELIGLLERDEDSELARRVREHVIRCRRCHALQAEATRSLLAWKVSHGTRGVPAEWLAAVRSAPQQTGPTASPNGRRDEMPASGVANPRGSRRSRWQVAAAAVIVLAIPLAVWLSRRPVTASIELVSFNVAEVSRQGMVLTANPAAATPSSRGSNS